MNIFQSLILVNNSIGGSGGSSPGGSETLDFSNANNSQYIAIF